MIATWLSWIKNGEMQTKMNFRHPHYHVHKMKVWVGSEMARNANENEI
jgi:hypothetical protein